MGAVYFSLDRKLVTCLQDVLPLDVLFETGTFKGDTIAEVGELFADVHSVELSDDLYQQARDRFSGDKHVHVYQGDSAKLLSEKKVLFLSRSTLFWLDAHWCVAAGTSGEASQCPLLDELAAIGFLPKDSVVLIDDARLFLCPPPEPHETSHWPSLQAILSSLRSLSEDHEVMVVNDVIAFFPPAAQEALGNYAKRHSINWLAVKNRAEHCDRQQQIIQRQKKAIESRRQIIEQLRNLKLGG